jgi:hypothetical protein
MIPASAIVRELIAAGVTGDALVTALERIEAAAAPVRSKGAERTARWRERHKPSQNVTSDAKEIPPTPPKENTTSNLAVVSSSPLSPPIAVDEAVEAWNEIAAPLSLPICQKVTNRRRKLIQLRLRDAGGIDGFRAALAKIRGSPFLCGDNDRGWRADIDFILQESSFVKLVEGKYDGSSKSKSMAAGFDLIDRAIEDQERRLAQAEEWPGRSEDDPVSIPRLRQSAA